MALDAVTDANSIVAWAQKIASRWDFDLEDTIKLGTNSAVFSANAQGRPAILKLKQRFGAEGGAVPFLKQIPNGVAADLLRSSLLKRAILIERIKGPTLLQIANGGDEATAETLLAEAAARLKAVDVRYPFVFADAAKYIARRLDRIAPAVFGANASYLARTSNLFALLTATTTQKRIIHGDLHFENVILAPDGVRMIDAKGFMSDPAADCARALLSPAAGLSLDEFSDRIQRRAVVFGRGTDEDASRIIKWGAVIWVSETLGKSIRSGKPLPEENAYVARFLDLAEA